MSVATKNPFALLEGLPRLFQSFLSLTSHQIRQKTRRGPPSPVAAPAPPPAPVPARGGAQKPRGGPAARGGKYYARGASKSGARTDESGNLNQNGIEDAPQDRKFDNRTRGGARGGRGGGAAARGGRGRQFDKHSWGAEEGNAELKAEEAAAKDANAEAAPTADAGDWTAPAADAGDWTAPAGDAAEWGTPAGDAAAPADGAAKPDREGRPPRREREPEEEDNTLTLEQYQAQKKESTVVPKLEGVRKANEGADSNIWKDAVPMQKDEEDAYFVGKSKTAPKARTKKEEKVYLEIEARFDRPRGGPRGGGRGGDDRGGRGRGAPRGRAAPRGRSAGGNNAAAVNVDDVKAFPSLS
ncbi:hypothetical protein C8J57DRAFT_1269524 [Mycena rebaudengoi]|nr:hypothetical protein C8J57DRAFT_1269524 [Mycena rebaudengoi]